MKGKKIKQKSFYYVYLIKIMQKKGKKMKKSIAKNKKVLYKAFYRADLAQLVEQLICNHQVVCSSQTIGTIYFKDLGIKP